MELVRPLTFGPVTKYTITQNGRKMRMRVIAKATFWDAEKRRLSLLMHKFSDVRPIEDAVEYIKTKFGDDTEIYSPLSYWKDMPCLKVRLGDLSEDGSKFLKKRVLLDIEFGAWASDEATGGLQLVTYSVNQDPESPRE